MSKVALGTKKYTTIWLEPDTYKIKMFFCFNCRIPLIEYEGQIVSIIPGHSPYNPSTILKCKGNVQNRDGSWEECGQYYSFVASVQTRNPESL